MSGYSRISFRNVCCLCLDTASSDKVNMTSEEGSRQKLKEKIEALLHLQVTDTWQNNLPKMVCKTCVKALNEFYSFYKNSILTWKVLSSFHERIKSSFMKTGSTEIYIKNREENDRNLQNKAELLKDFVYPDAESLSRTKNAGNSLREQLIENEEQVVLVSIEKSSRKASPSIPKQKSKVNTSLSNIRYETSCKAAVKKYTCEICSRSFQRREYLYQHRKIHKPDSKKFKCQECNASFLRKEHLQRHQLRHTGEKNNICHICQKRFTRSDNLATHILIHNPPKLLCSICGKQFKFKAKLFEHLQMHATHKTN